MTDTTPGGAAPAAPSITDELADCLRAYMTWVDIAVMVLPDIDLLDIADEYIERCGKQPTPPNAKDVLARYDAARMAEHETL